MAVASVLAITTSGASFSWVCRGRGRQNRKTLRDLALTAPALPYLLSQLLIFGCQCLAVATPGGIELQENILCLIIHYLVKVLPHHNLWNRTSQLTHSTHHSSHITQHTWHITEETGTGKHMRC